MRSRTIDVGILILISVICVIVTSWTVVTNHSVSVDPTSLHYAPVNSPPVITGLPDTVIFSESVPIPAYPYVNDLYKYVSDADDSLSSLVWSYDNGYYGLAINIMGTQASFNVPAQLHMREQITFTVTDPHGASDSDNVNIFVIYDGRPLIYGLPDMFYIPAGESIVAFDLDSIVYHVNESPESLDWEVIGVDEIIVTIDSVTHEATISSPNTDFIGHEMVQFVVKDCENKQDSHVMQITSINIVDVQADNAFLSEFRLFQNFPNPFNPTTTIQYDLPKSSTVIVQIYDILGREVNTLLSQQIPVGSHSIVWDGTDYSGNQVSSGIYIYRIQAGEYTAARKMILLK
ncbi:FlgD immunoglobulin-like domain containing protein [candidate division KSB1 bacterium]